MVWHRFFVRLAAMAVLVAAASGPAFAARPLITDDARIVDPKSCQLVICVINNAT
ncbi:hypothetical protein [Cupriavidus necator]